MKRRNRQRFFSIVFSFVLVISMLVPTHALANSAKYTTSALESQSSEEKISERLLSEFEEEEFVTFLLKFKEQVDAEEVASNTIQLAQSQNVTAAKMKQMTRSSIVSNLRATSESTQREITKLLEQAKEADQVKDFRSYFIVNGMAVTGTKEVMEKLASRPEVEKVLPNEVRQLNPTDKAKTPADTNEEGEIEWNIDRVDAPAAWDMGYDGSGIVVASIDTGVEWDHPSLIQQYRGYDPENPDAPDHEYNWFDATTN